MFCEDGYFSIAETETILKAGAAHNLRPKIHVNQFNILGGMALGAKYNALSVDHLEELNEADIEALKHTCSVTRLFVFFEYFIHTSKSFNRCWFTISYCYRL